MDLFFGKTNARCCGVEALEPRTLFSVDLVVNLDKAAIFAEPGTTTSLILSVTNLGPDDATDVSILQEQTAIDSPRWVQQSGFPAVIELAQLGAQDGFRITGDVADGFFGQDVASGGDLNGDGIDDVVFRGLTGFQSSVSNYYVLYGTDDEFGSAIDISELRNAGDTTTIVGAQGEVRFSGDVNADGIDDLIIGAFGDGGDDDNEVRAHIVLGSATIPVRVDLSTSPVGSTHQVFGGEGIVASRVNAVGDVNADGVEDLVIGAFLNNGVGERSGEVFVVFGDPDGPAELDFLNGTDGFVVSATDADDRLGSSAGAAGDVNGDGIDDLLLGAPEAANSDGAESGAAYVIFGREDFSAQIDLSALTAETGFAITGSSSEDNIGTSVSAAGDINGDGVDDIVVGGGFVGSGLAGAGQAYVIFGSTVGFGASFNIAELDGHNGFQIQGDEAVDQFGVAVAGAGDVNGDGFDDVIFGAPGRKGDGDDVGSAYVIFGSDSQFEPLVSVSDLNGENGFMVKGALPGDRAGQVVRGGGDLNGDGVDDLLVGAPLATRRFTSEGEAYVLFGRGIQSQEGPLETLVNIRAGETVTYELSGIIGQPATDAGGVITATAAGSGQEDVDETNNSASYRLVIGEKLTGDIDMDGHVSFSDFLILAANFGRSDALTDDGDLDGNETVDFADFLILSDNFGLSIG